MKGNENTNSAQGLFKSLENQRYTFLERARDSAKLTIPTLVPPEGHNYATKYFTPFQGIGARGVNNLASKLLLALLPPNSPFFRLVIDPFELQKLEGAEEIKTEMEKALSQIERAVMREVETSAIRVGVYEALRQLLVAGNVLVNLQEEGGLRVFKLDSYVVKRSPEGAVDSIVTKEKLSPASLPAKVKQAIGKEIDPESNDGFVELFTAIVRGKKKWDVWQEVKGVTIPDSRGSYPLDKNPYLALRFNRIDGENYGRGFVEEYIGDLRSLEGLTQSIVEGAAAASRCLFLVAPNGTTRAKTLADANNGAIVQGSANDVSTLQLNKFNDFKVALDTVNTISQRLGFAFLMNTSVQRQAERVTAEEIRYMAQELESALGGTYSILSQEFQLPLVSLLMGRMEKAKRLPKTPMKIVKPAIVTGVEALGRGNDLNKLDLFVASLGQVLGPEAIDRYVNVSDYLARRATAIGIDTEGLIKTEEQLAQEAQAAQMQQMTQTMGPQGLKSYTDLTMKAADQSQEAGVEDEGGLKARIGQ